MPRSSRFIRISAAVGAVGTLAALSTGCSSGASHPSVAQPSAVSVGIPEPTAVRASAGPATPPSTDLPADVEQTARAFTAAYAEHDARDGKDGSYADAGGRAAKFATGELVDNLSQKRPGQDAEWAKLRAEQAIQTVEITSAATPDGAPGPTQTSALVRVHYTLTTTPHSGTEQRSNEQLALRLEHTSQGWRVTALPWA
ncbi:hypothetical protein BG452_04885 [Streptomyces sp. CBMA123]|nr:hypothetical protein [Streptomyces sp. CBMA123]